MARFRSALSFLLLALVVSHAHGRELQQLTGLLGGVLGLVTGPQLPPLPLTVSSGLQCSSASSAFLLWWKHLDNTTACLWTS